METLKEKLRIESLPLLNEDKLYEKLRKDITKMLMNGYCIDNGQYQYRPIEIEFYIYDENNHPDRHVYPRDKKAGELFFHYSGMDICFETSLAQGRFGGILIRALERNDKQLFGGPLVCVNEVLNTAKEKCEIKSANTKLDKEPVQFGRRVGIKAFENINDTFYSKEYRFVRADINEKSTFAPRTAYNFDKNIFETKKSTYKIEEYIE